MSELLRPIDAILPRASARFGGKASNLAALVRAGFPVPAAYALSGDAAVTIFDRVLPEHLQPARVLVPGVAAESALAEARERVLSAELPPSLESGLRDAFAALRRAAVRSVAVRSSSTLEDQSTASAAGLHISVLNVQSADDLLQAVRQCWASLFEPRVLAYLDQTDGGALASIGVVVQAMVPADVAGVLFTVNPMTGDPDEMVISATYGLGTTVTDGSVTPDSYRIDKRTGWIRDRVLGDKRLRAVALEAGGIEERTISERDARKLALDEHTLEELVALGRSIEQHFGDARDIEFAIAGDAIYVLQARPVTTPSRPRRKRRKKAPERNDSELVWSNINVGEALPGVATPLTWSVLSAFSELGFTQAFETLGCVVPEGANLVGNFRGRIYLNLTELTEIAAQVPGLRPSTVLPLGGGAELERLEHEARNASSARFVARLPMTAARFVRANLGYRRRLDRFERSFDSERRRIEGLDVRILPAAGLDETLSDVHALLNETGSMMLTVYGGLLAGLVPLAAVLRGRFGDEAGRLQQGLLTALDHVDSADPGRDLRQVAAAAAAEPEVAHLLTGSQRPRAVSDLPRGMTRSALEAFMVRFGHRAVREAELFEPRWREAPDVLFEMIALQLGDPEAAARAAAMQGRARALRAEAEGRLGELPLPARAAVRALLGAVRQSMRLRERLRSRVTLVLGLIRVVALDASRRIQVREPEAGSNAAFFLGLEELHGWLRGQLHPLAPLLRTRRAQHQRDCNLPDPPDTFVGYPPAPGPVAVAGGALQGLAASGGQVEGVARVLDSVTQLGLLRPGEILVVPSADVGWAPVFLSAGGLVTDLGGPLSHACVVAREYGLPAVVNLRVATRVLKTGDRLWVDGDAGLVKVLS